MGKLILTERREKLLEFVKEHHGEQKRKYTGEPYWTHVCSVAEIVSEFLQEGLAVEIALCHDLFEDTKCSAADLLEFLEKNDYVTWEAYYIVRHVKELTDVFTSEKFPQINRSRRKSSEAERMGQIEKISQSVKYADLIDNTSSIADYDPGFAKVYLQEKKELLNQMRGGDINLYIKACYSYQTAINKLNQ